MRLTLVFRWLGRLSGLAVAVLFVAFWLHAPPHFPALEPRLRIQLALLITSVVAMLLGWWRELAGAVISLLALLGFLVLEASAIGRLPTLTAAYAMLLPGLFLLLAARRSRPAPPAQPAPAPGASPMKES